MTLWRYKKLLAFAHKLRHTVDCEEAVHLALQAYFPHDYNDLLAEAKSRGVRAPAKTLLQQSRAQLDVACMLLERRRVERSM